MRWQLAADAEVAGRSHNASAEHFLPEAVDGDAGRERMIGPHEPLREAEPVLRRIGWHRRHDLRRERLYLIAALAVLAAEKDEGERFALPFLHHMRDGAARLEGVLFLLNLAQLLIQILGRHVERHEPPVEQLILLLL